MSVCADAHAHVVLRHIKINIGNPSIVVSSYLQNMSLLRGCEEYAQRFVYFAISSYIL